MLKAEIMSKLSDALYKPLSDKELISEFNINKKEIGEFISTLDELEHEGVIYKTKKNKYILPEKANLVTGILSRNKRGFGFVLPTTDKKGDIYVPASAMNGAMNKDRVVASISLDNVQPGKAGSREGEIIKILERSNFQIVGTFESRKKYGFITGTEAGEDIFISKENFKGAKSGEKVVVKITAWPEKGMKAEGKIIEILGDSGDAGANIKALIRQYGISEEFPEAVLQETAKILTDVLEDEIAKRKDLREKTIVTIDGADAKDLDDAVSVEKMENGNYLLGVHIADVSYYVKEGSALDKEAYKRGCSVYLLDTVIPMLPPGLSNGICSLNPKVPRLTMTCEMEIDSKGDVISHSIYESVIKTTERLVYTDISDILEDNNKEKIEKYSHIYKELLLMNELAGILKEKRTARGSIDFDFDEAYITLNAEGIPIGVEIAERRIANRIIEEFMLKANETVSEHFFWLEIPFVYRVHESPDPEKIMIFKEFIYNFGYKLKGNLENMHPKTLNEIVKAVAGKPEEHIINTVMLRSLKKAIYSEECGGHFGLGVKYYSHFTSPIRRYPDLLIHRIIREVMLGKVNEKRIEELTIITREASVASSLSERNSEQIEREVEKLKKAEYMSYHIGEEYDAIVSGVAPSGFFVEIKSTIEGFVKASSLTDDYYAYERDQYRLIGERTKKIFRIGDPVKVKLIETDIEQREITFELI